MKSQIFLFAGLLLASSFAVADDLYKVVDGNKVDANTLAGWKTWRAMACERCHGAKQEGLVGPSLIDGLKNLSKDEFKKAVLEGRPGTVMAPFKEAKTVVDNIDNLYAYLKGRSDGAIKPGHLQLLDQ
ncbi:MAG TPA: cytochrome c [Burkholderiales bacterium]|nr:cytochrome c [Burkholderiales bacterium]